MEWIKGGFCAVHVKFEHPNKVPRDIMTAMPPMIMRTPIAQFTTRNATEGSMLTMFSKRRVGRAPYVFFFCSIAHFFCAKQSRDLDAFPAWPLCPAL